MRLYIDGELYESVLPIKIRYEPAQVLSRFTTEPPTIELLDRCEHCGRSDYAEVVLRSKEELIERGWVVKA